MAMNPFIYTHTPTLGYENGQDGYVYTRYPSKRNHHRLLLLLSRSGKKTPIHKMGLVK